MKGNLREIAGIINECFYYFNRIHYHAKKRYSFKESFTILPFEPLNPKSEWNKQRVIFTNKLNFNYLKMKPFLTQIVVDLNHVFKFSIFDNYKQNLSAGEFTRLRNGKHEPVKTLKDAITFFRDAIVHPEHYPEYDPPRPSPRSLPTIPYIYQNSYISVYPNTNKTDFYLQVGEVKIYLKADILKCLKKIKILCLKSDSKNILNNFKWQK